MASPELEVTVTYQDLQHDLEIFAEQVAENARRNERDYVLNLLQSDEGSKAIAAGGLATALLVPRLVKLIEEGAWKE